MFLLFIKLIFCCIIIIRNFRVIVIYSVYVCIVNRKYKGNRSELDIGGFIVKIIIKYLGLDWIFSG